MTIENSSLKPDTVRSMESDFGTSTAVYIFKKLINNHAWVEKCYPVGSLMMFWLTMDDALGAPVDPPNPDIWKLCDGTVVSDADSPLDGQVIPDLRDYFLKGSETIGSIGGQPTINLQHNHGGVTGTTTDLQPDLQADSGGDHSTGAAHHHVIPNMWSTNESVIPQYFNVQVYVRYK